MCDWLNSGSFANWKQSVHTTLLRRFSENHAYNCFASVLLVSKSVQRPHSSAIGKVALLLTVGRNLPKLIKEAISSVALNCCYHPYPIDSHRKCICV